MLNIYILIISVIIAVLRSLFKNRRSKTVGKVSVDLITWLKP